MDIHLICAASWTGYIADAIVILFALLMIIICGKKGFIGCLLGMISTLIAFIAAIFLAKPVLGLTDGLFGLQEKICLSFTESFAKIKGFDADISSVGVEAALEANNVAAVFAALIIKLIGKQEVLAPGTTLAGLLGNATSRLAATLIAGVAVFILIKLVVLLLKGVLRSVVKKIKLVGGIDTLLGALVGFLQAFLIVCGILAGLAVLPIESVSTYFNDTLFVGKLFAHNPLITILGWFL